LPIELFPRPALRASRRSLRLASLFGRHIATPLGLRKVTGSESDILAGSAGITRFAMWLPERVPVGFAIRGVDVAPYSKDIATIRLSHRDGRSFEVSERKSWLPLAEELTTAGVPFDRVPHVTPPIYLMHGKYGGEPIDLSFWNSRRALVFELGEIRVECREVVGRGPGLSALIRFAASAHRRWSETGLVRTEKGDR
jgi:hypothetical protein